MISCLVCSKREREREREEEESEERERERGGGRKGFTFSDCTALTMKEVHTVDALYMFDNSPFCTFLST